MTTTTTTSRPFSINDNDVVIVAAVRTPLTRSRKGGLAQVPLSSLFQSVLQGLLARTTSSLSPTDIQDICVGNVLMSASEFAALRMAAMAAGIPAETCSLQTTNRQCASGLQAAAHIANAIATGQITIGIAAGVESMSLYPMHKMKPPPVDWKEMMQQQEQQLHSTTATTSNVMDCLLPMGITSDTVVREYGLERHVLDAFAVASHQKAAAAQQAGKFESEIVPVTTPQGILVDKDDGIRPNTSLQVLSQLKPVFTPTGATTAGNSSQTTDGAAAALFMTRREARRRGLPVAGVWRGFAVSGVSPRIMGIGPAVAIPAVLQQTGLDKDDIDVYEINEAFASQASWCIQELGLDAAKVNPVGGAIALGHPLGCTGARMIATLLAEMHRRKEARLGVISMCIGTGMGAAAVIEVEPQSAL